MMLLMGMAAMMVMLMVVTIATMGHCGDGNADGGVVTVTMIW